MTDIPALIEDMDQTCPVYDPECCAERSRAAQALKDLYAVYGAAKAVMTHPDIRELIGSVMAGHIDKALAKLDQGQ